jgi:hypothetical protein
MDKGLEFFHQIPVNYVAKRSQPLYEARFIKGGISGEYSTYVLDIACPTGHKLTNNEILDAMTSRDEGGVTGAGNGGPAIYEINDSSFTNALSSIA